VETRYLYNLHGAVFHFVPNSGKYSFPEDIKVNDVRTLSSVQYNNTSHPLQFQTLNSPLSTMKASRFQNIFTDLEPHTDMRELQFFAVATAFALVLATTVAGKAVAAQNVGTTVCPPR
jgi:hypothetical protein